MIFKVCVFIQGDSKRLLKVHVSITSTFYGVGDLEFSTDQIQNYRIWFIRWNRPSHPKNQLIVKITYQILAFCWNLPKKLLLIWRCSNVCYVCLLWCIKLYSFEVALCKISGLQCQKILKLLIHEPLTIFLNDPV